MEQKKKKKPSYVSLLASQPRRCKRSDGRRWRCIRNVVPGDIYCEWHREIRRRSTKHVKPSQNVLQSDTTKTITETLGSSSTIDNIENITIKTSKSKATASTNGNRTRSKKIVDFNNESTDYVNLSSDDICTVTDTTSITAKTESNSSKKNNNDGSKDIVKKYNRFRSTKSGRFCKIDGYDKTQKKKMDYARLSLREKAVEKEGVKLSKLLWKRKLMTLLIDEEDCTPKKAHVGDLPIPMATVSDAYKTKKKKNDPALISLREKAVEKEGVNPSKLQRKRKLMSLLIDEEDCTPKKGHVGDLPIPMATVSDAELLAFSLEALKKLGVSTEEIVRRLSTQETDCVPDKNKTQEEANRVEQLEKELNTLREANKNLADKAALDKRKLVEAENQARKARDELVGEIALREAAEKAWKDLQTAHAEEVSRLKAEQVVDLKQSLYEEFTMGFFSGYQNLKYRASSDHPEWDLSIYDPKMSSVLGRDT